MECSRRKMRPSCLRVWRLAIGLVYLAGILSGCFLTQYLENVPKQSGSLAVTVQETDETASSHFISRRTAGVANWNKEPLGKTGNRPRIFCWVVTSPKFQSRAALVNVTWGKRCDKLLFMSSAPDSSMPTVALPLNATDNRQQLWNKAKLTYKYIYQHFLDDYDWFYKADTDTYAIIENMRHMVAPLNTSVPYFLGRRQRGFVSGGSGYLMTAATIRLLVEQGLDESNKCDKWTTKMQGRLDDVIVSTCLAKLKAVFLDTRDSKGLQRFIPYSLEDGYKRKPFTAWVRKTDYYKKKKGQSFCSDTPLAFHYVKDQQLLVYEYLTQHFRVETDW